jgi:DNA replication protein DnaC
MKNQSESLEHASVRQYCKAVRTPAIASNFLSLAEQAVKENHSHIRYLEALLALECEERDRHAIANRIRDAQLPRMKTLEEFDFAQAPQIPAAKIRELAGGYIERSEPVVLIGECARVIWQPDFALPRATRSGACDSRRRRPWSMSWWRPNRITWCGA